MRWPRVGLRCQLERRANSASRSSPIEPGHVVVHRLDEIDDWSNAFPVLVHLQHVKVACGEVRLNEGPDELYCELLAVASKDTVKLTRPLTKRCGRPSLRPNLSAISVPIDQNFAAAASSATSHPREVKACSGLPGGREPPSLQAFQVPSRLSETVSSSSRRLRRWPGSVMLSPEIERRWKRSVEKRSPVGLAEGVGTCTKPMREEHSSVCSSALFPPFYDRPADL